MKAHPSSVGAKALLGKVELLHGNVADALKWLKEAVQGSPYGASAALGLIDGVAPLEVEVSAGDRLTAQLRGTYTELQQAAPGPARDLALTAIDQRLASAQLSADFANYEKSVGDVPVATARPASPIPAGANTEVSFAPDAQQADCDESCFGPRPSTARADL